MLEADSRPRRAAGGETVETTLQMIGEPSATAIQTICDAESKESVSSKAISYERMGWRADDFYGRRHPGTSALH